jgi:hypothetical protein
MARPRKADPRDHQVNLRFTAPELVTIHRHAALSGKTVTEFGRAMLLRRPRHRKKSEEPTLIALADPLLETWNLFGTRLNAIAHLMNTKDALPPGALAPLLADLQGLFRNSFPFVFTQDAAVAPYTLSPAVRYHLRKVGANLTQIKHRHGQLGIERSRALMRLLERIRSLMNGDRPQHDP